MTNITGITADVRAALGTDLSKELQRLKPLEGKWGSRAVQTLQNELNRFINIFRTGKFTTEAQVCTRLDKEVKKLQKKMNLIAFNLEKGDINLVQHDIRLLESIDQITNKMNGLLDEFAKREKKTTKSYQKFSKDLKELGDLNQQQITRAKRVLENLAPRAEIKELQTPKAKVVSEEVTLYKTGRAKIVVPPRLQLARAVQETIKQAQIAGRERVGFSENLSREALESLKELLENEPEKLAEKPEKLLKNAKNACHEIRGAYVLSGGVPAEVSKALKSVETLINELQKSERKVKPHDQIASELPRLITQAYLKHDLRTHLSAEDNRELQGILSTNLGSEPEEAARLGKRAINLIAVGFTQHGRGIPAELEERLSDLEELVSKLPILAKKTREERPSELLARDLPGVVSEAFKYGIEEHLKAADKTLLEKLRDPEAVRKMPLRALQENAGKAIPILQRAVMLAYADIPPDLFSRMEGIEKLARKMQKFQGRAEEIEVKLTQAERARANKMAKEVKTNGQEALIKAITIAREQGGAAFTSTLGKVFGGRSTDNQRLDTLRDQEPRRLSSASAEEVIALIKKGFGDDAKKIPEKVRTTLRALERNIEQMREIESPEWIEQFRTDIR